MTTPAITHDNPFTRQLATLEQNSSTLELASARLEGEVADMEQRVREKRRTIHENNATIAANRMKEAAVTELLRSFSDAETLRIRAIEDYTGA